MIRFHRAGARLAALVLLLASAAFAALSLDAYGAAAHEFTLANGLKVVLLEDHGAPVVTACFTARGGYADDPPGKRGLARLMPLLLEEGPDKLGSRNLTAEKAAIKRINDSFAEERRLAAQPGSSALFDRMRVEAQTKVAIRDADMLAKPRFNRQAMDYYGATGYRATSSADNIQWMATLPSNRIDAFLLLYGEWLRQPFPRRVFGIKYLVLQEVQQFEQSQEFALRNTLLPLAFGASGYGLPEFIAAEADRIGYADVEDYLRSRFAASNLTLTLAGDLTPASARALAEKYLAAVPAGKAFRNELAPPSPTPAPNKALRAAPPKSLPGALVVAYRRPPEGDPDDPVFDLYVQLMTDGPESRFQHEFMKANPLFGPATQFPSLPGSAQGGLMLVVAPYHPSKTSREWLDAISTFLEEPGAKPPTAESLESARAALDSRLLGILSDPVQSVMLIGRLGGWKQFSTMVQAWAKVTPADVQRVTAKYVNPGTRVLLEPGYVPPAGEAPKGAAQ